MDYKDPLDRIDMDDYFQQQRVERGKAMAMNIFTIVVGITAILSCLWGFIGIAIALAALGVFTQIAKMLGF